MSHNISLYGSHNGGIAFKINDQYRVIEIERFTSKKNLGLTQYRLCKNPGYVLSKMLEFAHNVMGAPKEFDNCIYANTDVIYGDQWMHFERNIKANNYVNSLHHRAHAAGTFYQSPFEEAIVISYDGGGSDGFFNLYTATRETSVTEVKRIDLDLGFAYMIFGHYLQPISFEGDLNVGNLVYSGKLMGLCGYGRVRNEWVQSFREFYLQKPNGNTYTDLIKELGKSIEVDFNIDKRVEGETALDIAATSQYVFESIFFEKVDDFITSHEGLPICITGGCALNVVCNTKLKERYNRPVFVAPNSNDCGIALGMLLDFEKPSKQVDATYAGLPLLDSYCASELYENKWTEPYTATRAAELLASGFIAGAIRGNSEHGPRALGNRSILCNPSAPDMKNILNSKVKKREWFRPFAPVVRLEDVEKYFNWQGESRFMSFYCTVKDEWKSELDAITHIDGTARIQTVTYDQNPYLYDLLTEFDKLTNFGVLLNTSFNVNGKPLINTHKDALYMLENSGLDLVFTEDYIVFRY